MTVTELQAPKVVPTPNLDAAPDSSLAQIVREYVEQLDTADPEQLIETLIDVLDDDLYDRAARKGLGMVVSQVIDRMRSENRRSRGRSGRSGKWDSVADAEREHRDVFEYRLVVGRDEHGRRLWKFLGDCDKRDLAFAEDDRRNRGEGLLAEADRFKTLAAKLRGGKHVRELDRSVVEEILDA